MKTEITLPAAIAITVVTVTIAAILGGGCWNLTGQNQEAAEVNATAFAETLEAQGVDAKVINCNKHDTDGDGYLSCNININGELTQVECAGYTMLQVTRNEGCRAPKLNLRTMPRSSGQKAND